LDPHKKIRKYKKVKKNMFGRKPKNNSIEKKMLECPENDQKLVEKVQKYKNWNLTIYFFTNKSPVEKENLI